MENESCVSHCYRMEFYIREKARNKSSAVETESKEEFQS